MNSKKSVIYVLTAAILWGCMGILVRTMSEGGFNSLEVTAFRSFVTTVCMFVWMFIKNHKGLKIKIKDLWCFIGTGILSVTFFNVCYFSCMKYTTLSVAAILLYTAPSFVMVMSSFLFKEPITKKKLIALVLAFAGCVLVSGGFTGDSISAKGLLLGLGAGFGYGLYSIFGKYALQRGYSTYTITTYTFLFALVGTMPFMKPEHVVHNLAGWKISSILFALAMAILTTVVAYLLYTKGLQGMESGKAAIVASVEPVMAAVVGTLLYKERMQIGGVAGMMLVLLSCIVIGKDDKPKENDGSKGGF